MKKKTSKTKKCKNRKTKNNKTYNFRQKPYVKNNVCEEKNYFSTTTFFNERTI